MTIIHPNCNSGLWLQNHCALLISHARASHEGNSELSNAALPDRTDGSIELFPRRTVSIFGGIGFIAFLSKLICAARCYLAFPSAAPFLDGVISFQAAC